MKGEKSKSRCDNKLSVKQGGATKGGRKMKKEKPAKDSNKPKRPASAFFVFMEEFRKEFKEKHPENKAVSVVGKAGGEKWKSLTAEEKAPYVAKAEGRKTEYEKAMKIYNNGEASVNQAEGTTTKAVPEEEHSDKSISEVEDEGSDQGDDD
uniref:HMG box domain-containing protein n=2 Tax=Kalanchoe fedtschenkoi TaxID=63787 RepID=A0A7N0USE3_KALFE